MKAIKNIFKTLVFDNELVNDFKENKVSKEVLYTYLISGKISMKEYLSMV